MKYSNTLMLIELNPEHGVVNDEQSRVTPTKREISLLPCPSVTNELLGTQSLSFYSYSF